MSLQKITIKIILEQIFFLTIKKKKQVTHRHTTSSHTVTVALCEVKNRKVPRHYFAPCEGLKGPLGDNSNLVTSLGQRVTGGLRPRTPLHLNKPRGTFKKMMDYATVRFGGW